MRQFYTYLHCKPDGTPFYVGKGSGRRAYELSRRNNYHKAIVAKYGIEIFVFPCDSESQAHADEMQQIAQLRKEGYELCNLTDGGEGLSNPPPEVREKISAAAKAAWNDQELRGKMCKAQSVAKLGNKNAVGNSSAKGNTFKHTDDAKRRMSEARKGNKYRLGSTASEETKLKMAESQKKRWKSSDRAVSEKELQIMKQLRSDGMSYGEIAEVVGRNYETVYLKLKDGKRCKKGVVIQATTIPEHEVKLMLELRATGKTYEEIAAELKRGIKTVWKYCNAGKIKGEKI